MNKCDGCDKKVEGEANHFHRKNKDSREMVWTYVCKDCLKQVSKDPQFFIKKGL